MIVIDGTLKQRLAGWLLAAVGLLGTFLLIEAYTSAQRAAGRAYDSQLQAASLTIAEAVQWQDGEPIVEIPAAALQILATDHQERVFYTLLNAAGQQITGNLNRAMAKSLGDAFSTNPMWKFAQNRGVRIRLYGRELRSAGWESSEPVQIWVGHTMSGREALAKELFSRHPDPLFGYGCPDCTAVHIGHSHGVTTCASPETNSAPAQMPTMSAPWARKCLANSTNWWKH
ncbi:MAG: sensor histidine kinase N-terminal domain-containing protein [Marinobacter sp.]|nr:sensor histidine kinase N-terminal domain-containing protein [Marinobacter sp.]